MAQATQIEHAVRCLRCGQLFRCYYMQLQYRYTCRACESKRDAEVAHG